MNFDTVNKPFPMTLLNFLNTVIIFSVRKGPFAGAALRSEILC